MHNNLTALLTPSNQQGDIAAEEHGEDGMTADEILEALPEAMRWLREPWNIPVHLWQKYSGPEVV